MKTRREFLKTSLAAGAALSLGGLERLFAAEPASGGATAQAGAQATRSVLVAVRDGERAAMLDRALAELGGMKAFVKPGQTVLVKPNIGWDVPPERGANTHPELVQRIVELCLEAGARSVQIFDNPVDEWRRAYETSGIEAAARKAGATMVNGKDESLYRQASVPRGVKLREARVHRLYLDADVVINVPVLKTHGGARITACLKNLMGVVWDRRVYHQLDLHQCIADFVTLRKPELNILDAYQPMVRNGPRGRSADDCVVMRTLLVSTDPVAVDAAGARMLNLEPDQVAHIPLAAKLGLGTADLDQVEVRRIRLG
ncbi:DUF362 domain-containing protein [Limisphaera ngatamarikiensis]|uniref:DUF362 domain-containing protein n=1 Tax=Limisphaera ngatamarikiensis TaxID=1324935 RepID=A0A6M1RJQ8_9BACT|nr:DUF362 domain-containing protein [Limisphaera ngatamarikiensis]NGO40308.1 DUF362 domain-containing protein [Limisphaera ngatamarikiensis]